MKKLILVLLTALTILMLSGVAMGDTIFLRDGRTIRGTLIGFINGRFAFRVATTATTTTRPVNPQSSTTPRVDGEIQFFRPNEVDRVEIDGRSLDDLKFETRNVEVQLGPNWVDSGVDLRRNERVQTTASGTILTGRSRITPAGLRNNDPSSPLPNAAEGLLIAAIGSDPTSPVLELGTSKEFVADRDGRLYLTLNRGSYTDARGSFVVQIKRERDLSAMGGEGNPNVNPGGGRPRNRPRNPSTTTSPAPRQVSIEVAGTSRGTDTNIDVRSGDQIRFTTTGRIVAGRRIGEVGPEGGQLSGFGAIVGIRPVPNAGPGALIGYIRLSSGQTSQPFLVGSQLTFTVPADGRLFLAINDDNYTDNSGSFTVKLEY
jgi:hypothetical protein